MSGKWFRSGIDHPNGTVTEIRPSGSAPEPLRRCHGTHLRKPHWSSGRFSRRLSGLHGRPTKPPKPPEGCGRGLGHGCLGNMRFHGGARVVYGPGSRAQPFLTYPRERALGYFDRTLGRARRTLVGLRCAGPTEIRIPLQGKMTPPQLAPTSQLAATGPPAARAPVRRRTKGTGSPLHCFGRAIIMFSTSHGRPGFFRATR